MKFKATDEQIKQIAANAVNHSAPVGMGFLHHQPGDFSPNDFQDRIDDRGIFLDYVQGRMVKLSMWRKGDMWEVADNIPHPEYQSWCRKYHTYSELIGSAGVEANG